MDSHRLTEEDALKKPPEVTLWRQTEVVSVGMSDVEIVEISCMKINEKGVII